MTPEQQQLFDAMTPLQKAEALQRAGWVAAGDGSGPLAESEWWPPQALADKVPEMTCDFEHAVSVTLSL